MRMNEIYNKHIKDKILYIIFGILTTLTNIFTYWIFTSKLKFDYINASIFAWVISVVFAFITNKLYVFNSKKIELNILIKEALYFFAFRILSLLIDLTAMFLLVQIIKTNDLFAKVISNIIVIIINYYASKLIVFKQCSL